MATQQGNVVRATRSEYTESLIRIEGKPFSLANYPMFRGVYNGDYSKLLLMTCRQVGKSTTLANYCTIDSITRPFFKTFFIAPSQEQTHKFSVDRVAATIEGSPIIKDYFTNANTSNRVLTREFAKTLSKIYFSYASDNADRCRGVTANRVLFDEVQDMLLDVVQPVVLECYREMDEQYEMYCGTPKTMENSIQHLWVASTQTEWMIKCDACGKYNAVRSEKAMGPLGPVCQAGKCRAYLNPRNGVWIDVNPGAEYKGFHISRLIMPRDVPAAWAPGSDGHTRALERWTKVWNLLHGKKPYSLSLFRNEVLGVSDSVGRRLVTIEHLRAAATGPLCSLTPAANMAGVSKVAAGIDWSGGGSEGKSRTVLVILGWLPAVGKSRVLFYKIFPGTHPVDEVNEIYSILCKYTSCGIIGADEGGGNMPTDLLRKKFGITRKVHKFKYVDSDKYSEYNQKTNLWNINRTRAIDRVMMALGLHQEIQFPSDLKVENIAEIPEPFEDILNEYEEMTGPNRDTKRWRHAPTKPDDFLHALNYADMALQMSRGAWDLAA